VSAWLHHPPAATGPRIFCIPQAGSGTTVFDRWPDEHRSVEFLPIELPGRLSRYAEPPSATMEELAADLAAGLAPYLDVPFAFFGHCWSAILAYQVTRHLEAAGQAPSRLFVSAETPPQVGPFGRMLHMDDTALFGEVEAGIREAGRSPHPELVSIYVRILRQDIELRRHYAVAPPLRLACPITAFRWQQDPEYREAELAGWAECGTTTFTVFPGPHNRFTEAPPELIATLCRDVLGPDVLGPDVLGPDVLGPDVLGPDVGGG
jgi:surfactin synthase thioesterase subunit